LALNEIRSSWGWFLFSGIAPGAVRRSTCVFGDRCGYVGKRGWIHLDSCVIFPEAGGLFRAIGAVMLKPSLQHLVHWLCIGVAMIFDELFREVQQRYHEPK